MWRASFFGLLICLSITGTADGQWRLLKTFDATYPEGRKLSARYSNGIVYPGLVPKIFAVYFLTKQGAPNVGFVSARGYDSVHNSWIYQIWRSSDAGQTWNIVHADTTNQWSWNFAFESPSVGYTGEWASSSILKTMDGGLTWLSIPGPDPPLFGSAKLFYNKTRQELFATGNSIFNPLWMSTNHGTSWTTVTPNGFGGYGMSFTNDTLGYVSGYYDDLSTTNSGLSWTNIGGPSDGFQPLALPPSTFYNISWTQQIANRSFDSGKTWHTMTIPGIDQSTGDIEGSYKRLYVIGRKGVSTSTDSGTTWHFLCGPTNDWEALHFVRGDTMYTGDYMYGLWMNPTGMDSDVRYPLLGGGQVNPASCHDTTVWFALYNGNSCSHVTITSFFFFGSNRFKLLSDTSLHHGPLAITDTLSFQYDPYGVGKDTLFAQINYKVGTDVHLDTFYIIGQRTRPITFTTSVQSQDSLLVNACDSNVNRISLTNTCCDTLAAYGIHLTSGKYFIADTSSRVFDPYATITLRTVGKALRNGIYRDTLVLNLWGDSSTQTLRFPLYMRLANSYFVQASSIQIVKNVSCSSLDTVLTLKNLSCDTLSISGITLSGRPVFITSDSNLKMPLAPGATLSIPVAVWLDTVGTFSSSMTIHLTAGGQSVDTVIYISLSTSAHRSLSASQSAASFANPCAVKDIRLTLANSACDTMTVSSIEVFGQTLLDTTLLFPLHILPDSSISLPVAPTASTHGQYSGNAIINYVSHGIKYDTELVLQYSISGQTSLSSSQTVASFVDSCTLKDFRVTLENTGCDTLFVNDADIWLH
jgi:hypothetical protein